jgi:hypothetical protein
MNANVDREGWSVNKALEPLVEYWCGATSLLGDSHHGG